MFRFNFNEYLVNTFKPNSLLFFILHKKKTPFKNFVSEVLIYLATIPSVLWGVFALGFFISWQYKFKGYNLIVPLIAMTIISLPSVIILFRDKLLFIKRYYY